VIDPSETRPPAPRISEGERLSSPPASKAVNPRQSPPSHKKIPQSSNTAKVGGFTLGKKLGEGAMGEVWLARDRVLDRDVALKFFRHSTTGSDPRIADFLKEARAAAKLNHPNIVTIHRVGSEDNRVFIAMEYVQGGSLADELQSRGPLSWPDATRTIHDAAAGLREAHAHQIIHRDIKPSNLMRSAHGSVKVVDFGLAKARDGNNETTQTQPGMLLGSPAYMSPEQCRGGKGRCPLRSLFAHLHVLPASCRADSLFRHGTDGGDVYALS
jgi:serine/threonine protein kinase